MYAIRSYYVPLIVHGDLRRAEAGERDDDAVVVEAPHDLVEAAAFLADAVLRAILNPGDEVIVAEPCYVSYQPLVELCDTKLSRLDTAPSGFIPTAESIEAMITPKTKVV